MPPDETNRNQNDPKSTWRLASYLPPEERRATPDRRKKPRAKTRSRRRSRRSLRSLLRL